MDATPLILDYVAQDHASSPPALATHVFATIGFGDTHDRDPADPANLTVGLRQLNPTGLHEQWRTTMAPSRGWQNNVGFVATRDLVFAHLLAEESRVDGLADTAFRAYLTLLTFLRDRGFNHLLRIWNFVPAVHELDQGIERYQAFCIGRDRAFSRAGIGASAFPAATAIGSAAPGLLVYAFAARQPGIPIENPRQISAYRYPTRYSPRPPAFARALKAPWRNADGLFISGTASVRGHRSMHRGNLHSQLQETLANLDAIADASSTRPPPAEALPRYLKVYLRHPAKITDVAPVLADWSGPGTKSIYLRGEICRRELELEIEGYNYAHTAHSHP